VAVIVPKTRVEGYGHSPLPRIKVIIQIITIYYLKLQTVGVKISGSRFENHRGRGLARGLATLTLTPSSLALR